MTQPTKSGCSKFGGSILADTEDWLRPLCVECWIAIGSPEVEPKIEATTRVAAIQGSTTMYVEKFFYDELVIAINQLRAKYESERQQKDRWFNEHQKVLNVKSELIADLNLERAKHERVLQALKEASKRSTYEWTDGYDYFPSDHANEGRIALANELLKILGTP